jgi:hypothetical protein
VEDCERFFRFTQQPAGQFAQAPAEARRQALVLVCSKLLLTGQRLTADLRPPFDALAAFPLAGAPPGGRSEPSGWRAEAEKPEIVEKWLGILDAIRTFWLVHTTKSLP